MCGLGLRLMFFYHESTRIFTNGWTMEARVDGFFLDRMNRRDRIFLGLCAWVVFFLTTEDTEITELG